MPIGCVLLATADADLGRTAESWLLEEDKLAAV